MLGLRLKLLYYITFIAVCNDGSKPGDFIEARSAAKDGPTTFLEDIFGIYQWKSFDPETGRSVYKKVKVNELDNGQINIEDFGEMTLLHETRLHNSMKLGWQFESPKPIKIDPDELGQKAWGTKSCKIGTFALPDENCVEDVKQWYCFAEDTRVKGHPWGWRIEPDHLIVEKYFVITTPLQEIIDPIEKTSTLDIDTKSNESDLVLETGLNFNKEFFREPLQSNKSATATRFTSKLLSNSKDENFSLKSPKDLSKSATDINLEDHLNHLETLSDFSHSKPSIPIEFDGLSNFDVLDSTKSNYKNKNFVTQNSDNLEAIPDIKSTKHTAQYIADFVASSYIAFEDTATVNTIQNTIIKDTLNSSKLDVQEPNGSKETSSMLEKIENETVEDLSLDSSSQNLIPQNFAVITNKKVFGKLKDHITVDNMLSDKQNDVNSTEEIALATDKVGYNPARNLEHKNSNLENYNSFEIKIISQQPVVDEVVTINKIPIYSNGELDNENFASLYKEESREPEELENVTSINVLTDSINLNSKIPNPSEEILNKEESMEPEELEFEIKIPAQQPIFEENVTIKNIPTYSSSELGYENFGNLYKEESMDPEHVTKINMPVDFINLESEELSEFGIVPDHETVPVPLDSKFLRMKEMLITKCKITCANIGWNWTKVLQNIKCKLCYMFASDILTISDSIQHSMSS